MIRPLLLAACLAAPAGAATLDAPIPLPGALWLLGVGIIGIAAIGRRKT